MTLEELDERIAKLTRWQSNITKSLTKLKKQRKEMKKMFDSLTPEFVEHVKKKLEENQ